MYEASVARVTHDLKQETTAEKVATVTSESIVSLHCKQKLYEINSQSPQTPARTTN